MNIQKGSPEKSESTVIACASCKSEDNPTAATYQWLECVKCGSHNGFYVKGFDCSCGSNVFQLTKDRLYCLNCGDHARWKY